MQIKGDKDGFAGQYKGDGLVWEVTKHYLGKGIGARWMIKGPYFAERSYRDHASMLAQIKQWSDVGVNKH